ncbi:MAG: serine/threonine protein kinase [Rhodospirillales bacterium]|nr:serine/threonine protein kinase [Rhodospirillales bacterium]
MIASNGSAVSDILAAVADLERDHPALARIRAAMERRFAAVPLHDERSTGSDDETVFVAKPTQRSVGPGDLIKGRFRLEQELGAGGMGTVFKALDLRRQEARDREPFVAMKLLSEGFRHHPDSFIALQREAKKAQSLAHPNIIRIYDFDRDGDITYLVMEYLSGQSLDRIIKRPGFSGLPFPTVREIIRQAGEALAFAHRGGIVHSDFKPSNVFVGDGDDIHVKVIDFGIARSQAGRGYAGRPNCLRRGAAQGSFDVLRQSRDDRGAGPRPSGRRLCPRLRYV